jgi:predicted TIM-barrel fold metal-dependent hydrolase
MCRLTYDTIGHNAGVVKFLISEIGADRVMLGSDYCLRRVFEHVARNGLPADLHESLPNRR